MCVLSTHSFPPPPPGSLPVISFFHDNTGWLGGCFFPFPLLFVRQFLFLMPRLRLVFFPLRRRSRHVPIICPFSPKNLSVLILSITDFHLHPLLPFSDRSLPIIFLSANGLPSLSFPRNPSFFYFPEFLPSDELRVVARGTVNAPLFFLCRREICPSLTVAPVPVCPPRGVYCCKYLFFHPPQSKPHLQYFSLV